VTWIDDDALRHLRAVIDRPDLSDTRYVLLDTLGRGGMGTVYLARDTALDREVALKVLTLPDGDDRLARRMRDEAGILARLEHPGIVPVHDAGRLPDGRVFYVMKRVRGRRLDQLDAAAMSIAELVRIARRICDPVAFAHAHGIIHRDLKPQNVMIGDFGEVLVLDWGVAKVAGALALEPAEGRERRTDRAGPAERSRHTAAGDAIGTPGWMAPEQHSGDAASADERADVYGVAALLFFLLCGGPPPPSDDDVRAALERRRPPLHRRLRAILARGLAADPSNRYVSVHQLADDLDRWLDGEPVAAHRETLLERAGAWLSKYRTAVILVLTYIVLRILFIVLSG
jgi:serine/threonine protein kinase